MKSILYAGSLILFVVSGCAYAVAQTQVPPKASAVDPAPAAKESLTLAEHGKCKEALQLLRKTPRTADKELKLKAGIATVRCAINLDQTEAAA
jgi:hypothetical protein